MSILNKQTFTLGRIWLKFLIVGVLFLASYLPNASANTYHLLVGNSVQYHWNTELLSNCQLQNNYYTALLGGQTPNWSPVNPSGTINIPDNVLMRPGIFTATLRCRDASNNNVSHNSQLRVYPQAPVNPSASCSVRTDAGGTFNQIDLAWQPHPWSDSNTETRVRIQVPNFESCPAGWTSEGGNNCFRVFPAGVTSGSYRAVSGSSYTASIAGIYTNGMVTAQVWSGSLIASNYHYPFANVACSTSAPNISTNLSITSSIMGGLAPANTVYTYPGTSHSFRISGSITNLPADVANGWVPLRCFDEQNEYVVSRTGNSATFTTTYNNPANGVYSRQVSCYATRPDGPPVCDGDGICTQPTIDETIASATPISITVMTTPPPAGLCRSIVNPSTERISDFCSPVPASCSGVDVYQFGVNWLPNIDQYFQNTAPNCNATCGPLPRQSVTYNPNRIQDIPMCSAPPQPLTAGLIGRVAGSATSTASTTVSVPLGTDLILSWNSTGATSCNILPSIGTFTNWSPASVSTSGSRTVRPEQVAGSMQRARLSCTDGTNTTSVREVVVSVVAAGAPNVQTFTIEGGGAPASSNITVPPGTQITLRWNSTGATSCIAIGSGDWAPGGNPRTIPTSGTRTETVTLPDFLHNYAIRCVSGAQTSPTRTVSARTTAAGAASITSFTAQAPGGTASNNITAAPGASVTFNWNSSGTTGCSISSSPAGVARGSLLSSGSAVIAMPAAPANYTVTLTCNSGTGNVTRPVTVNTSGGGGGGGPGTVELFFIRN